MSYIFGETIPERATLLFTKTLADLASTVCHLSRGEESDARFDKFLADELLNDQGSASTISREQARRDLRKMLVWSIEELDRSKQ